MSQSILKTVVTLNGLPGGFDGLSLFLSHCIYNIHPNKVVVKCF